jgi:RecA/RadA recombinase
MFPAVSSLHRFQPTPAPENLDGLLTTLPRSAITELLGPTSSGRTALAHTLLSSATRAGEVCAVVDTNSTFDPKTAQHSGVELGKLLWVDCHHRLDHAMKATDWILHAGGFGLIVLDVGNTSGEALRKVPTTYWYKLQRAVEDTTAILLLVARESTARACSARQIEMESLRVVWRGKSQFALLEKVLFQAGLRKPFSRGQVPVEAVRAR